MRRHLCAFVLLLVSVASFAYLSAEPASAQPEPPVSPRDLSRVARRLADDLRLPTLSLTARG